MTQITALIIENTFMSLPRLIPTAMPWLGPFSFLCHEKWESYLKVTSQLNTHDGKFSEPTRNLHRQAPKLPPTIPVLMLGGARDDVVPRSQMQELWTIMRNRGRGADAAATRSKPFASLSPSVSGSGPAARRAGKADDDDDDNDDNDDQDGPGPDDPKVPPRVVVDGQNKYIEFGAGTHSECPLFYLRFCAC